VLSKKRSLQEYFDRGTVFGSNEAGDIALAIRHAYTHRSQLASDAEEWATKARADMSTRIAELRDRLQEL
jgi:hypothetical protein